MQLKEECKNMENNIVTFKFLTEDKELSLDLDSPNFSDFVKNIINKNYNVSNDNISVSLPNSNEKNIDIEALKDIVIEVHKDYNKELKDFYRNIESEISTYYDDEDKLLKEIENFVRKEESKDISTKKLKEQSFTLSDLEESEENNYANVG